MPLGRLSMRQEILTNLATGSGNHLLLLFHVSDNLVGLAWSENSYKMGKI